MGNLQGFDPAAVEPQADVLPAGEYRAVVIESSMDKKDSGAVMLSLTLQIVDGQFQNRKVWESINYVKKDGTVNQIGAGQLSALCRSVGVMNPNDTSDLHNKPFVAKIAIRQDEGYEPKNTVKSFKPMVQNAARPASPLPPQASDASSWAASVNQ